MVLLEPARPEDASTLAGVQTRAFDDYSRRFFDNPKGGPPGYDSVDWQLDRMKDGIYYKILVDGRIIGGTIVFRIGTGHYRLGRIWIDPDFQNQGIGTRAIRLLEGSFPDAKKWSLDTPVRARRNHHFYEKLGFVEVGTAQLDIEVCLYEKVRAGSGDR